MNTLYFVKTYNFSTNWWARFLVTATEPEDAIDAVQTHLDGHWSQLEAIGVCETDDDIFTEI